MKDYSLQTRKIYHAQHERVANDEKTMKRFISMFSTKYFGVEKNFFEGKKILDAGCGNTGKFIQSIAKLKKNIGKDEFACFDLGEEFIEPLKTRLKNKNIDESKCIIKSGSLLDIPFPDESFDFVCCHGVLVHLNNEDEVKRSFKELSRVCKKNGFLYTDYGVSGGLFEEAIIPAVRAYYNNNDFKDLIDNIGEDDFSDAIDFIQSERKKHDDFNLNLDFLKSFFDTDLSITLQNIIQAPVRLDLNEEFVLNLYNENKFNNIKPLKRYVKRENIRTVFSPLHYAHESKLSKILYGSGNLEYLAEKQ